MYNRNFSKETLIKKLEKKFKLLEELNELYTVCNLEYRTNYTPENSREVFRLQKKIYKTTQEIREIKYIL